MILLFYTTYISVDLAHHEIFGAEVGKGGIKNVNKDIYPFLATHDFCHLPSLPLMFLSSLHCKQYGPRSDCCQEDLYLLHCNK